MLQKSSTSSNWLQTQVIVVLAPDTIPVVRHISSCKEQSSSFDHKAVHGLVYNLEHFKFSQSSLWHPGHRPSLCYFIANILLSSSNTCNYALPQVPFFADNNGKKLPKASFLPDGGKIVSFQELGRLERRHRIKIFIYIIMQKCRRYF